MLLSNSRFSLTSPTASANLASIKSRRHTVHLKFSFEKDIQAAQVNDGLLYNPVQLP